MAKTVIGSYVMSSCVFFWLTVDFSLFGHLVLHGRTCCARDMSCVLAIFPTASANGVFRRVPKSSGAGPRCR